MHPQVKNRLKNIIIFALSAIGAIGLLLKISSSNIAYYYTPSEIPAELKNDQFRLGGLVQADTLKFNESGLIQFKITDGSASQQVHYYGVLPDIFREGQGVVAIGKLEKNIFLADKILAKHDENYRPPATKKLK